MIWFATVLAHLLVLFLVIVVPLRGAMRYRVLMLRIARRPELRAQFYWQGMLGQWLMLIPLALAVFGLGWSAQTLGLQSPNNPFWTVFLAIVLICAIFAQVVYIRRAARTVEGRMALRQGMSGPLHMLPRTAKERALWVLLSMTAGFCEELLYRGFLTAYLQYIFPQVNFLLAILISAALFGIGHVYQKFAGVLGTGFMGLVFGFLYFFTGSLFLPMVIHAIFDLRLLLIDIRGITDNSEDTPQAASLS
ncbi:MAG TPA: CPBP family intramembrane glutamic endopeptidase [Ktedonobacteraceae bacterium]|nr:CPBP family intramembrane glutamic endopeptidase [Ktedonobacteraceae bacterium]